jgi:hypothetical protein
MVAGKRMLRASKRVKWGTAAAALVLAVGLAVLAGRQHAGKAPAAGADEAAAAVATAARAKLAAPPSPDGIALASPRAGAVRVSSSAQAWGGVRTGNEATLSDRVVSYTIQVSLDPERHTVTGNQQLTWMV